MTNNGKRAKARSGKVVAYNWRNIPVDFWTKVRMEAVRRNMDIREMLSKAVEQYIGK